MQAAIHTRYGPPEVVTVHEAPTPVPGERDVLIRIHAATVNRTDSGFRSAEYIISRFWSGLLRPREQVLGCAFAGEITAVGAQVTKYAVGDRVLCFDDRRFGGHAEYVCKPEGAAMAIIPPHCGYVEAAALTEGAVYAINDIRAAKITAGDHVMVYGATGAIGSSAVQILKHMGAHVTAVCGSAHVEVMRSLGPDLVVDYQTEDYTAVDLRYDLVFDAVGKSSFGKCKPILKKNGCYISTELGRNGQNVWFALFKPFIGSKKVLFPIPVYDQNLIQYIVTLVEQEHYRPLIDRTYPLQDIVEAYRYVETGKKLGNVVVTMNN